MLTAEQTTRLAALANRATRYEVVVAHPDGRTALVGYTARKTRPGLRGLAAPHLSALWRFLGVPQGSETTWGKGAEVKVWGGGAVRFTGRTQRDAIMAGEAPALPKEG